MKVKISSIYASPNHTAHPGSIMDVSEEEGAALIDGGYAVEVKDTEPADEPPAPDQSDAPAPETAAAESAENAAQPKPRRRRLA